MKVLLLSFALLALAVLFCMSEPAPASAQPVTSTDVQMVSEQNLSNHGTSAGKNGNSGRNGNGGIRNLCGRRSC